MNPATFIISIFSLIIRSHNVNAIIRGKEAKLSDYNYMVSVWRGDIYLCGGAILDETHIITAGHCFTKDRPFSAYSIKAGVQYRLDPVPTIKVTNIQTPEDFAPADMDKLEKKCPLGHPSSDVAVVTLEEALVFNDQIGKVKRPSKTDLLPSVNERCIFTGWGATVKGDKASNILRYAKLSIMTPSACRVFFGQYRDNELCVVDPAEKKGPASGDSGSPLVYKDVIYAVHSTSCANPKRPSLMSNVILHLDFIEDALKN